jgi:phosphoribosylaminoimidazole-succinocarboxamide synthase
VLNELAAWWFRQLDDTHLSAVPDPNATVAFETTPLSVEIVMRGYITGVTQTSLWYRYSLGEREIYGYRLPDGLVKNQQLERPLLTPTTKGGPSGHDERLTLAEAEEQVGTEVWDTAAQMAREIFAYGQEVALERGLLLVDSKYEFGVTTDGRVLEPDSFDKEFVRLAFAEQGYRGDGEPPEMPDELWKAASRLYIDVYEQLTGQAFVPGFYPVEERLAANLHREGWL